MKRPSRSANKAAAKKRKKLVGLVVLVAALGGVWAKNIFLKSPRSAKASATVSPAADTAATPPSPTSTAPVSIEWPPALGRDPFALDKGAFVLRTPEDLSVAPQVPPDQTAIDQRIAEDILATLALQAVVLSSDPRAIINGRTVRVGDDVDGLVVRSIEKRRVVLVRNSAEVMLEM